MYLYVEDGWHLNPVTDGRFGMMMGFGPAISESGWESNPPRPATRPATGFEDQEAHRDLTTPTQTARTRIIEAERIRK